MGNGAAVAAEARKVGNDAFKKKDFDKAVEAYTRAIEEDGNDCKIFTNRAAAYMGLGKPGFAYNDARRSLELDCKWHKAHFRLGQSLMALGAPGLAAQALRACDALAPGDAACRNLLEQAESKVDMRALRGAVLSWGSDEGACLGQRLRRPGSGGGRREASGVHQRAIEDLKGVNICEVACGLGHGLAVGADGSLRAWGLNSTSQCAGAIHEGKPGAPAIPVPTLVPSLVAVQVVAVACGAGHSIALSKDGFVYSWGLGKNGQLGLGPSSLDVVPDPRRLDEFRKKTRAVGVACGFAHTLVVDDEGHLFACGWNAQGQTGIEDANLIITTPSGPVVPSLSAVPALSRGVRHVACGGVHTVVVFSDASANPSSSPPSPSAAGPARLKRSSSSSGVSRQSVAAAGSTLSLARSVSAAAASPGGAGELRCFGANSCGQLGLGHLSDLVASPQGVTLPGVGAAGGCALAACGEEYTFAITERREVFAFGLNNVGQLGLPIAVAEDPASMENVVLRPARVEALADAGVEWIVSGQGVSYAVCADGAVWTWGSLNPQAPPQPPARSKAFGSQEVLSIVSGRRHFCALCRSPVACDAEMVQKTTPAGLRPGRRVEFEVTLRTTAGEVWRRNQGGQPVAFFVYDEETGAGVGDVDVLDNMDGTFTVAFKPEDTGTFLAHCFVAGEPVVGSPKMVEVDAGPICFEKCSCTMLASRRVRCGDVVRFFVTAKDAKGNFVFGGRQRASVRTLAGEAPDACVFEDEENGQSIVELRWDKVGTRRLAVDVADAGGPPEELKRGIIDVLPGRASPPHFVFSPGEGFAGIGSASVGGKAEAGVPFVFTLLLNDRFGNPTPEMPSDLEVRFIGPQPSVPVCLRPPLGKPPSLFGVEAWSPAAPEQCLVTATADVRMAGEYRIEWRSGSCDECGEAKLTVTSGPPDWIHCKVSGVESRVFRPTAGADGRMALEFGLLAFDAMGNRCTSLDAQVGMRLKNFKTGALLPGDTLQVGCSSAGAYDALGYADTFGEWHLDVRVDGKMVLGSPFVIHLTEDPSEVARREEEARAHQEGLREERERQAREAEERRTAQLAEERRKAAAEIEERKASAPAEANTDGEVADEAELERRRKIYERLKREEAVRNRAAEVLRRELEEKRARLKREKEQKEKRCGGGFTVTFRGGSEQSGGASSGATSPASPGASMQPPRLRRESSNQSQASSALSPSSSSTRLRRETSRR